MNKNTQSFVLAQLFMKHVKRFEKNDKGVYPGNTIYKMILIENSYKCLLAGNSFQFMKEALRQNESSDTSFYNVEEFMRKHVQVFEEKRVKPIQGELIQVGLFYYHPLLQETASPPTYKLDSYTMKLTKSKAEPFYLEIRESFTIEQLLSYYYTSHHKDPLPGTSGLTQMMNLVKGFGLDMALYLIEASSLSFIETGRGATTHAFLPEFLEEAKELFNNRLLISKEGGLTHVTPREDT